MSAFLAGMRAATTGIHDSLEKSISLPEYLSSLEGYSKLLARFAVVWFPVERSVANSPLRYHRSVRVEKRMRSSCIVEDFECLKSRGITGLVISPGARVSGICTLAEAAGCLYVLEGSRFGGAQILSEAKKIGISPEEGGRFFHGYGVETGAMWRDFIKWADTNIKGADLDIAARSAVQVFQRCENQFGGITR